MSCCSHMRIFHLRWPPTFAVYFAGSLLSILAICTYFVVVATALCFRENTKFVHSSRHRYRAPVNCNCIGTGNLYGKLSLKIDFFFISTDWCLIVMAIWKSKIIWEISTKKMNRKTEPLLKCIECTLLTKQKPIMHVIIASILGWEEHTSVLTAQSLHVYTSKDSHTRVIENCLHLSPNIVLIDWDSVCGREKTHTHTQLAHLCQPQFLLFIILYKYTRYVPIHYRIYLWITIKCMYSICRNQMKSQSHRRMATQTTAVKGTRKCK